MLCGDAMCFVCVCVGGGGGGGVLYVCVCVCMFVYVCVCVCLCVCMLKKLKIGIHWPEKATSISCVVDTRLKLVAVNSSALQAVEWCNPSTSCYV